MSSTIDYHHVNEALDILKQLIESIKNGEFVDDFYKTKKLIIENSIARERTTQSIIDRIMDQVRLDGKITTLKETLFEINRVQFKDVQHIVEQYFTEDKIFTEIVRPLK